MGGDEGSLHLLFLGGERGEARVANICALVLGRAEQQLLHRVPVGSRRRMVAEPEETMRAQGLRTQPYPGRAELAEPAEHPRAGRRIHRFRKGSMFCLLEIRRGQVEKIVLRSTLWECARTLPHLDDIVVF